MAVRNPHRMRKRIIFTLVAIVAAFVVVLLALIVAGVLVLPSHTPAPVTIRSVSVQFLQGTTPSGALWFHVAWYNLSTAEGYPLTVSSGGTWHLQVPVTNWDSLNHTIYDVAPNSTSGAAGFRVVGTSPATPATVPGIGYEEGEYYLSVVVAAPSTPGSSYQVGLVLNAQTPS